MNTMLAASSQLVMTLASPGYISVATDLTTWSDQAHFEQTVCRTDWLIAAQLEIQALGQLKENWDSYGAEPIQQGAIRNALLVVAQFSLNNISEPDVSATPDGSVAFGWDTGDWSLDVEIGSDGKILFAYLDRTDAALSHEGVFADWQQIAECLSYAF